MIPSDPEWLAARADAAVALLFREPQGIEDEVVQEGCEDMHDAAALYGEDAWREALQAALERRGMGAAFR